MRNAKTLLEDATKHYPDFAKVGHCFFLQSSQSVHISRAHKP